MRQIFILLLFLCTIIRTQAQVTFVIKSLPNTTPEEDTLFISGSFNNWLVNDEKYILHQRIDGKYTITIPTDSSELAYKFTRGSWFKVETDKYNRNISNRLYIPNADKIVSINIENWLDLGGAKQFNYIIFILFALALYSLTLIFFVARIPDKNKIFFRIFLLLNSLLFGLLVLKISYIQLSLIWQSRIILIDCVLLFLWSPCLYLFFYVMQKRKILSKRSIHFFPVILIVIWFLLRIFNFKQIQFFTQQIYIGIPLDNFMIFLIGIALNVFYLIKSLEFVQFKRIYKEKIELQVVLINRLFLINCIAIVWIIASSLVFLYYKAPHFSLIFDVFLIIFSGIIFVEFYFFWKYPVLVQASKLTIRRQNKLKEFIFSDKPVVTQITDDEKKLMELLIKEMEQNKIFKDPDLNITKLSKKLEVKKYLLSKLLNEHIHKTFRDFINEYRINEFISLAISEKYKNFTFLALGYEVGFNSKSTFNLAFKKVTGLSPREYLKKEFNSQKNILS